MREVVYAFRYHFTHVLHRRYLFYVRSYYIVYVFEMSCYLAGRLLAHISYAQCEKHSLERHLERFLQRIPESYYRALLPPVKREQLIGAQCVEVCGSLGQSQSVKLIYGSFARENVHRLTGREMQEPTLNLHRASSRVRAEPLGLTLGLDQRSMAIGAVFRELRRNCSLRSGRQIHSGNLRDYLAAFLNADDVVVMKVAHADVQQCHLVGIVQGRALDYGSGQLNRLQIRYRGNGARSTYLIVNAENLRASLFCLEFEGYCPARGLGRISQLSLVLQLVDFDYDAVGSVRKRPSVRIPIVYICHNLVYVMTYLAVLGDRQAPTVCHVQ